MIRSVTNARVKDVVRLRQQPAYRRECGSFCVERPRELRRALDAAFEVAEIFVCPPLIDDPTLIERAAAGGAPVTEVTEPVLKKMSYRDQLSGFVVVLKARLSAPADVTLDPPALVVVGGGVEKPGNIGAILRSADAAGVSAVAFDAPDADVFNPNTVRASTGAVFSTTIVCDTPEALVAWLRANAVYIAAAAPDAQRDYTAADLRRPCAIILGAEDAGLDQFWHDAADVTLRVPMRGAVDSLNVSVTAALLLFEAVRQRADHRSS